jgi:hypothetical protein
MSEPLNRRAALGALTSIPALAVLPVMAPASTTQISALIETHRAAYAAFCATIDPLEAAEPDKETPVPGFGDKSYCAGDRYDDIVAHIDHAYAAELEKTAAISALSPEIGRQARALLEARKAFCLSRLDEVFADHAIAEATWNGAREAEDDAIMAICEHRCSSLEEAAIRARYLASPTIDLQTEHVDALLASFLPEGADEAEDLADV